MVAFGQISTLVLFSDDILVKSGQFELFYFFFFQDGRGRGSWWWWVGVGGMGLNLICTLSCFRDYLLYQIYCAAPPSLPIAQLQLID